MLGDDFDLLLSTSFASAGGGNLRDSTGNSTTATLTLSYIFEQGQPGEHVVQTGSPENARRGDKGDFNHTKTSTYVRARKSRNCVSQNQLTTKIQHSCFGRVSCTDNYSCPMKISGPAFQPELSLLEDAFHMENSRRKHGQNDVIAWFVNTGRQSYYFYVVLW